MRAPGKEGFAVTGRKADWAPKRTALIVCDMWDDHWCKSAARRVAELAGPMNEVIRAARARGLFVIHAPSTVTARGSVFDSGADAESALLLGWDDGRTATLTMSLRCALPGHATELWPNLGDGEMRKAAYRGG